MRMHVRRGTKAHINKLLFTGMAVFALLVQPMYALVASQVASAVSGTAQNLQDAIDAAPSGGTVTLTGNVTLERQIDIKKSLTIDGGGLYSITANYTRSNNDNDSIIGVYGVANTATLRNVILDGGGMSRDLHGVDIYISNVILEGVTIRNTARTAVNVNGSVATINNLTTVDTAKKTGLFGAYSFNVIELAQGGGVTRTPALTIGGTSSHNETAFVNGNHIRISTGSVTDTNGQYTTGNSRNLIRNINKPTIATPTQNQTLTTNSVNITWNAIAKSNSTQAAASYNYRIDGGAPVSAATNSATVTLPNGTHTIEVEAVSATGLTSGYSTARTFVVDGNQAPTIVINTPADGAVVSTIRNDGTRIKDTLRITGNFSDDVKANYLSFVIYGPGCGPSPCVGTIYGYGSVFNPSATYADIDGNFTYNMPVPANLAEGTYTMHVSGTDFQGGVTKLAPRTFVVDNTHPQFAIITPANNSTVKGTQRISATITDAHDITKVLMNVGDGKGNYVWEAGKTNNKVTRDGDTFYIDIDTKTLLDGVNYVVLRATDGAGNTRYYNNNSATRQHSYTVDNTAPTAAIDAPTLTNNTDPLIKGIASDAGSGVKSHWFEIKAPNGTLYYVNGKDSFNLSEAKDNQNPKNPIVITDGEYRIRYVVTDNVNNRSDDPNYTNSTLHFMTIDTTAPKITIYGYDEDLEGVPALFGTVDDPNATVEVTLDGVTYSSSTGDVIVYSDPDTGLTVWVLILDAPLIPGLHTVSAVARDTVGNESTDSDAFTVAVVPQPVQPEAPQFLSPVVTPAQIAAQVTTQTTSGEDNDDEGEALGDSDVRVNSPSASKSEVLGDGDVRKEWSLVNTILAGVAALMALIALAGIRKDGAAKAKALRVVTLVPAIAAVVAVLLTEDFSAKLGWFNLWTILFAGIVAVQAVLMASAKTSK